MLGERLRHFVVFGIAFYIRGALLLLDSLTHRIATSWGADLRYFVVLYIAFYIGGGLLRCRSTRSRIVLLHAGRTSSTLRCFGYSFVYWGCSAVVRLAHASYCFMLGECLRYFVVFDIAFIFGTLRRCRSARSRIVLLHAGRRSSILRWFGYSFVYWGCSAVARLALASCCYMLGADLRHFVVLD